MRTPASDRNHDAALDGIRGVAIALILFHHLVYLSGIDRKVWFDWQIFRLADSCWLGVDLFFVLSGFLITRILYDARSSPHYFRNFYGRRVLRIFPVYYGSLLLGLLVIPPWLSAEATQSFFQAQGWYWLYLSNIHIAIHGWPEAPIGHFWSLAIEEQFYLIWPLLVLALNREKLIQVSLLCMIVALALRIWLPFDMDRTAAYVMLPTRMDSLAAGAIIAMVMRGPGGIRSLGRVPAILAVGCGLVLAIIYLWERRLAPMNTVVATVGYTLIATGFAAVVAMTVAAPQHSRLRRLLSAPTLVMLGKYSYALYVIHVPIIWMLRKAGFQADLFPRVFGSSLPGVAVFSVVALAISLALAMLSYRYLESPFLRLKRYLPYRAATTPARPVPARITLNLLARKCGSPHRLSRTDKREQPAGYGINPRA
ncbi:MAG TPA: acyltransferase [Gammaproteobacteria bacterium]|nr:acyltransferase [Gammaproteobacteria bacterium]